MDDVGELGDADGGAVDGPAGTELGAAAAVDELAAAAPRPESSTATITPGALGNCPGAELVDEGPPGRGVDGATGPGLPSARGVPAVGWCSAPRTRSTPIPPMIVPQTRR